MKSIKLSQKEREVIAQDVDDRMQKLVKEFSWQYDSLAKLKKRIVEEGKYP